MTGRHRSPLTGTSPMESLPADAAELLASLQELPEPGPAVCARTFARVAATVGLPPPSGPGGPTVPSKPTSVSLTSVAGKSVLVVVAIAALGGAGYWLLGSDQAALAPQVVVGPPTAATVAVPSVPVAEPVSLPLVLRADVEPSASAPLASQPAFPKPRRLRRSRSVPPNDARAAAASSLAQEQRLLDQGRRALRTGDGAEAVAAAQRHAQRFPEGLLAQERDALRIRGLIAAGRRAEATTRAQQFYADYPRSLYRKAVETALSNK